MTRRTGLGRRGRIEDAAGDPLDGLVNLFDIGIVLAVAFLVAGLGFTLDRHSHSLPAYSPQSPAHRQSPTYPQSPMPQSPTAPTQRTQTLPSSSSHAPVASGHGQPVGTVYRLGNGQLVYVQKSPRR